MWSVEIIVLIFATFFIAGLIKGMVGLGLPIVVLVFLAVPIGVNSAIALMLVPAIVTNLWQAISGPSLKRLLVRLWSFLVSSVLGIWVAAKLASHVPPEAILNFLGILLALYSVFSLSRPQIRPPGKYEHFLSPAVGGLSGVIYGTTGTFIIPGIVYLQALGLKKNDLVQALGITFVTISATLMGSFLQRGIMDSNLALFSCAALLPTAVGIFAGQKLRHRVSESLFRTVFFWVLLFVGLYFAAAGQA